MYIYTYIFYINIYIYIDEVPSTHVCVTIYSYMRHHLRMYASPSTYVCVTIIIQYQ